MDARPAAMLIGKETPMLMMLAVLMTSCFIEPYPSSTSRAL